MQFFKHYHNTDTSTFIQKVIKVHGLIGYAWWYLLLELLCEKFNGESVLVQLTVSEVAKKLRIKPAKVHSIISSFSELSHNQAITKLESNHNQDNFDGFIIIISAHILLDLQDRDFKRARKDRAESAPKNKIKNKDKEREKEKEKERPVPQDFKSCEKVTSDFIINLFNEKLAGVGKVKSYPSYSLSPNSIDDLKSILGFPDFKTRSQWENYFAQIAKSDFLTTRGTCTLPWVLNSNNAFKVLSGQYQNFQENGLDEYHANMAKLAEKYAGVSA